MIRIDADTADTLSQLGSEIQHYHLHAESQSDELNQTPASNTEGAQYTEGAQFWNLLEEARTANAGIAPDVTRSRTREEHIVFDVSTLQNRDTELQRLLQSLFQESARIDARMHQSQTRNNSMNRRSQELRQQLQTSKNRNPPSAGSDLRKSVERSQSTEN